MIDYKPVYICMYKRKHENLLKMMRQQSLIKMLTLQVNSTLFIEAKQIFHVLVPSCGNGQLPEFTKSTSLYVFKCKLKRYILK